jgi:hypothetical protein
MNWKELFNMSLINDALKRAKKAQQDNPPPAPPLQLRPAEPPAPRSAVPFVLVFLALVVVLIAGGLLLWTVAKQSAPVLRVEARTMTPPAPVMVEAPKANIAPSTKVEAPAPQTVGQIATALVTDETLPGQPQTNGLPVAATVEPPKPAGLKLQAILYNPNRPSAILSGKTVFIGDRVGEFRVLAMTQESVTIGNATVTNVLSLGE